MLAALVVSGVAGCPGGGGSPTSDICRTPAATASVTAVSARHVDSSTPLADGDVLPFTTGGQGITMIGLELVLEGDDVPGCADQETTLLRAEDGTPWLTSTTPLATYDRPDGSHVTGELWLFPPFDAARGSEATLRVESYGALFEVDVYLDRAP